MPKYSGFVAQYKYNDWRVVIYLFPNGSIELYNRHRQPFSAYKMSRSMERSIHSLQLESGYFHVLDGGLLYGKSRGEKDRIILWDILVHKGQYLIGTTYKTRYALLAAIAGRPRRYEDETGHKLALRINENLWLAPTFRTQLAQKYAALTHLDEIEGLLLKDPNGRLEWGLRESNNGSWQIRVRKRHANYPF